MRPKRWPAALLVALSFSSPESAAPMPIRTPPPPAAEQRLPQARQTPLVRAKFVPLASHARPGSQIEMAILFVLEPGWHIYWKNAGAVGSPTTLSFELPAGFSLVRVSYPAPDEFVDSGGLESFGYAREAVIFATLSVSPRARSGSHRIRAHATWVACREICVPDEISLSATVSVQRSAARAVRVPHAERARSRLPRAWRQLAGATCEWRGEGRERSLRISVAGRTAMHLFPGPGALYRGQTRQKPPGRTLLESRFVAVGPRFPDGRFEGVLRVGEGRAVRYYSVSIPWPR